MLAVADALIAPPLATRVAPPPTAVRPLHDIDVDETAPLGLVPRGDSLPFRRTGATLPAAAAAVTSATTTTTATTPLGAPSHDVDVTLAPSATIQGDLLPFIRSIRAEASRVVSAGRVREAPSTLGATVELRSAHATGVDIDVEETLPPTPGGASALPFKSIGEDDAHGRSAQGSATIGALSEPARGSVEETAFMSRDLVLGPATPFDDGKPGDLSLEQYAAFLGELSRDPSRAAELRLRFRIRDEDAQRAIGARFAAAFARDATMRARFDVALARARERR